MTGRGRRRQPLHRADTAGHGGLRAGATAPPRVARGRCRTALPGLVLAVLAALACGGRPVPARAAQVDVQAWLERTRVSPMEGVGFTVSVSSDQSLGRVGTPQIDLGAFEVQGPAVSTRTNVSIVNFKQTASYVREFNYTLYPRRSGRLVVGPARVDVDGTEYQAKALLLEVVAGSAAAPQGQSQGAGGEPGTRQALFLRARPSRQQAYVGEPVNIDYELCYRVPVENVSLKSVPAFSGFWVKDLYVAKTLQARREVIDGVAYNVSPLRRVALFPTRAGRQSVEPLVVSCDIPASRGAPRGSLFDDLFDDAFFGRAGKTVMVQSDSLAVRVLPLPEAGRPAQFAGAVGELDMQVEAAPTEVAAGDPVTLRVTLNGWGNLEAAQAPQLDVPDGVKVHGPEVRGDVRVEGDRVGGTRVFEYILVPESGGQVQLEPVRYAYFDTGPSRYRVLERPVPAIRVRGGTAATKDAGWTSFGMRRRDIEAIGTDIRYIKPDAPELGGELQLHRSFAYWFLQGLVPVAFGGLLVYQRHLRRLQGDVAYARRRRARGEAGRRLARARTLLDARDSRGFHAETQRAVLAFLGDRLNLPSAGLSGARCLEVLAERGVPEELRREAGDIIASCEAVRFANVTADQPAMEALHERAAVLIGLLEKLL